ncbi:uncharacterized protein LOC119552821 [Drosophila subpulchrella]|uniref:uncharacterized protein LOC119552821 n=1 Tax=Drosophila subpulchrella TaxID=1486046 RepID=UPI0018A168F5|nr:uncharacterized protein LOC119552821 [Drosophila subpulchrella]
MAFSASLIIPPPLGSDIPYDDSLKRPKYYRKVVAQLTVSMVVTLTTAAIVVLLSESASYSLSKNWKLGLAALIYLTIINLLVFWKSASKTVLLALYAAAQMMTLPYCASLILNIQGMIDGHLEKKEYIMAAIGLVPDIICLSIFIVSMCLGGGGGGSGSSSFSSTSSSGSSGSSSGGSSGGGSSGGGSGGGSDGS